MWKEKLISPLPRPSEGLITQMLSNGAPLAQMEVPRAPSSFAPVVLDGDPLAFNGGRGLIPFGAQMHFPGESNVKGRETNAYGKAAPTSFPPSSKNPPFPMPMF